MQLFSDYAPTVEEDEISRNSLELAPSVAFVAEQVRSGIIEWVVPEPEKQVQPKKRAKRRAGPKLPKVVPVQQMIEQERRAQIRDRIGSVFDGLTFFAVLTLESNHGKEVGAHSVLSFDEISDYLWRDPNHAVIVVGCDGGGRLFERHAWIARSWDLDSFFVSLYPMVGPSDVLADGVDVRAALFESVVGC